MDFDGDGQIDSETDGRILLRQLAGMAGDATTDGLGLNGPRTNPNELWEFVNGVQITEGLDFFIDLGEINDRTGGDPFGTDADFIVSPTAVVGSSAWKPIFTVPESRFVDTATLANFGDTVQFEDTFLTDLVDPPVLVSSGAVGTPARTTGANIGDVPEVPSELEAFARRQSIQSRAPRLGIDEPIFIGLPDAAQYDFTLSSGAQFTGLGFDASAADNRFLDHNLDQDGSEVDFDLFVPATGEWFQISTNSPRFTLPAGTTRFQMYPRQLPSIGADTLNLLPSIGLLISEGAQDPVVTVTHNYDRLDFVLPAPQVYVPTGLTMGEFRLARNQAHVDLSINGVQQPTGVLFTHPMASLTEIPLLGTDALADQLIIDSRSGPIVTPLTFIGGHNDQLRDVVRLEGGGGTINLATDLFSGVELLDIQGSGSNTLILDARSIVANMSDEGVLLIIRDDDDVLDLTEWTKGQSTQVDGFNFSFDVYEKDNATIFVGDDPATGNPPNLTPTAVRSGDFMMIVVPPTPTPSDAVQLITADTEQGENGDVRVNLNYGVENPLAYQPNHLQLQIHYDSNTMQFNGAQNEVTDGFEVCQEREEAFPDSNPDTDRMIVCLWYDDANGWPANTDLPAAPLMSLDFTVFDVSAENVVEILGDSAVGYEFQAPTAFNITGTNTDPTISTIGNQTTSTGVATSAIAFTVGDAETAAADLTVSATSNNTTLVPEAGIVVGGAGADRTITLTPANGQTGTATITVTVTDAGDASATETFDLTVNGVPTGDPEVTISPSGPGGDPDPLPGTNGQPTAWATQRSSLRQISVDLPITPAAASASDLVLTNLGVDARAGGDADQVIDNLRDDQLALAGNTLTINLDASQLSDGVYQLELKSALTGGAPFTLVGSKANGLFVLTGDWNGSGAVTVLDFATFNYWFGSSVNTNTNVDEALRLAPEYADLNHSGAVTVLDFAGFSSNFNKLLKFPGDPAGVTATPPTAEGESLLVPPVNRADVNADGAVTARDALRVIDALNASVDGDDVAVQADVNGDGRVTAADVLTVINRLAEDISDEFADANEEDEELASIDQLLSDRGFLGELF